MYYLYGRHHLIPFFHAVAAGALIVCQALREAQIRPSKIKAKIHQPSDGQRLTGVRMIRN